MLVAAAAQAAGVTLQLVDGRRLTGDIGETSGVAENPLNPSPSAGEVRTAPILIVDDGLRRTFVHKTRILPVQPEPSDDPIKIRLWQNVAQRGGVVGGVGRQLNVTPFDQHGRRIFEMQGAGGAISVVQGITEITPVYTRVRGLAVEPRSYVWDMRLATSSIPPEKLNLILHNAIDETDPDERLQLVRFYLQSARYRAARQELQAVINDFPHLEDMEEFVRRLRQLGARAILDEIELQQSAGQHQLARVLLENFPSEGVAGEMLGRVREMLTELNQLAARRQRVLDLLSGLVESINEPAVKQVAEEIAAEITAELNVASLPRMTAFVNLADGEALDSDRKAALAISGWLLGSNNATDNLAVALSLFDVRAKVIEYLREGDAQKRRRLLGEIRDMEGGDVNRVAELLKLIKPPLPLPEAQEDAPAGVHEVTVPLGGDDAVRYLVQLPPEYDPLRKYPAVVTLNGVGFPPEMQLDYWAGGVAEDGRRRGQAMRHGYITIAVEWLPPRQTEYRFSAGEHARILAAYRDALRRLAIDTDRVFISGHDVGANAAWDIAVAHPDHWAGVIPVIAEADKYIGWYSENAQYVPWYFVCGELDGDKMASNARELDRYLRSTYDTTVVEFLGRGHDPFTDEIQRLFDWMGRKRRQLSPEEFEVRSLRPWDNYFWWVEFAGLPAKSMVPPRAWPPERGVRAARLRGRVYPGNKLGVFGQAERTTVWLSPGIVDFDQPIEVTLNGRRITDRNNPPAPDLGVLLEDVRTRGDRHRPFWAKVEAP